MRQKIRDEYIRDATVAIVLIGPRTWQRKHVDWEHSRAPDGHYAQPHIHLITQDEMAKGHTQPQENQRLVTDKYVTLEEALRVFFQDTATANYARFFPELLEPRML